jgi:hypothetical protein
LKRWARLFWLDKGSLKTRLDSGLPAERALIEQGNSDGRANRIIITGGASFEERAALMCRFLAQAGLRIE